MKKTIYQIRWVFTQSKPILPYLAVSMIITVIMSGIGVYNAIISKSLIDAATSANLNQVFRWIGIMGIIFVIRIAIGSFNTILSTYANTKLTNNMQKRFYNHVTYSEWMEHSRYHSMNLLTRLNGDIPMVVGLITGTVTSILSLTVTLIASFFTLLKLDPSMAIMAIIIAPVFLVINKLFSKKIKYIYEEVQDNQIRYNSFIQESLQNIMIVKTFCREEKNIEQLNEIQANKMRLAIKSSMLGISAGLILQISSYLTYFIVFSMGAIKLANGIMTFGTLTALLQLYRNIQSPLSGLGSSAVSIIRSFAAVERLLDIENMMLEKEDEEAKNTKLSTPSIGFRNIKFGYKSNSDVLSDISFDICPGETIALVGPSGGGKTTIIRLILSLISPKKGNLYIYENNKKVRIGREHRHIMSYVPQGNTLFSGTIKENLCYGNDNATIEDIIDACKKACAWDFIDELDNKLDTIIGERGLGLSEGQAQRIAIARSFLRKKPILILDEATSALDPQTEINVLNAVKELNHNPTCIIITHRPQALEICDRVLRLENGELDLSTAL